MKVTRRNVFETNSSSTHSITIVNDEDNLIGKLFPSEDGIYRIWPGEFGWEVETYNSAVIKASYALTWTKQIDKPEYFLEMLRSVIAEQVKAEVEFVSSPNEYNEFEWGFIDHQSCKEGYRDVCREAFDSKESLRNFIFNPLSILHTDNDNH